MLSKIMIILPTGAALTGGLTADALARGGGGHMGGGGGGLWRIWRHEHVGGEFGARMGGRSFGHAFAGRDFAGARGHVDRNRQFFAPGWGYGYYDYACDYGYPYYRPYYNSHYNLYGCYSPSY